VRAGRGPVVIGVVAGAVAAVVLVVVATQRSPSAGPAAAGSADGGVSWDSSGKIAPFRLESLDRKQVALPRAGRPGMLIFSGIGCPTDIETGRDMGEFKRAHPGVDAAYVSVDPGETPETLADHRERIGDVPYRFAIDTTGQLATQNRIAQLGTVLVYDASGGVVARFLEPRMRELREAFENASVT
jgi:hypothetical protein